jgi:hypothetical protein
LQAQRREFMAKTAGPVACTEACFSVSCLQVIFFKNQIELFAELDKVGSVTAS